MQSGFGWRDKYAVSHKIIFLELTATKRKHRFVLKINRCVCRHLVNFDNGVVAVAHIFILKDLKFH